MNPTTKAMNVDWERLYDENAPALVMYARQWLHTQSDAEDAVQDAFVRLIKSPQQFSRNPVPVLYQAVKWAALDRNRSSERRERREESTAADAETVQMFEDQLEKRERRQAVERAMKELPDEQREVLTMRVWGELGFREIGEALGISLNTAASRYRYALKNLSKAFENPEMAEIV